MKPSDNCINLIKQFEGFRSAPYLDAVNVATIGYGTTMIDGKPVTLQTPPITEQRATELLRAYVENSSPKIIKACTHQLTQGQFDAIISFVYNLGIGNFQSSTLLKKLNAWDILGASLEFDKWVNAGGKKLPGLITRRAKEKALFLS
jgi:GH24 family phage-related lysozyme (muramidase)